MSELISIFAPSGCFCSNHAAPLVDTNACVCCTYAALLPNVQHSDVLSSVAVVRLRCKCQKIIFARTTHSFCIDQNNVELVLDVWALLLKSVLRRPNSRACQKRLWWPEDHVLTFLIIQIWVLIHDCDALPREEDMRGRLMLHWYSKSSERSCSWLDIIYVIQTWELSLDAFEGYNLISFLNLCHDTLHVKLLSYMYMGVQLPELTTSRL